MIVAALYDFTLSGAEHPCGFLWKDVAEYLRQSEILFYAIAVFCCFYTFVFGSRVIHLFLVQTKNMYLGQTTNERLGSRNAAARAQARLQLPDTTSRLCTCCEMCCDCAIPSQHALETALIEKAASQPIIEPSSPNPSKLNHQSYL
jgi:hypothetical protein